MLEDVRARRRLSLGVLACLGAAAFSSTAQAIPLVATNGSNLTRFDSGALATTTTVAVTGLQVGETLVGIDFVRLAHERDAQALVVGAHGHGRLSEVLLGSTSRSVIRTALCPVRVSPATAAETAARESAGDEARAASR